MAFIGQRIGEPLKWRHIRRNMEGHNIEDKILHCFKTSRNLVGIFFNHLPLCKIYNSYIKQTRWQNMAEIVFSWGVSEIKYIIFIENHDYPYENYNNYIKSSIVFHPMITFFRKYGYLISAMYISYFMHN
jgi:hypothetical protein